jgi:UDP-N-acetylglucosamine transferase subunit ALG13
VIFVSVGTQLTFDRMIKAVDEWAGLRGRKDVFAQVGPTNYTARHIEAVPFISPKDCMAKMRAADVIVAHAGMGSIIGALELGKPILIMPRRANLGEHRNDHQLATARRFAELGKVAVAMDEHELMQRLDALGELGVGDRISPFASERLINAVRAFIHNEPIPAHRPAVPVESVNA